jgi:hypothetical protein
VHLLQLKCNDCKGQYFSRYFLELSLLQKLYEAEQTQLQIDILIIKDQNIQIQLEASPKYEEEKEIYEWLFISFQDGLAGQNV